MKLSRQDKEELSRIRFEKAREFLRDAQANVEESRFRTGVNRAYYAALHAIRSLLVLEGLDSETHSGAITVLSLHFVKPGLLPAEAVKTTKLLLSRRTDVDYGDFDSITEEEARDSLVRAEALLDQIGAVRDTITGGSGS
ncbi:MAG: HEPN domain-containing protein [Spirochaetaceae bacterium]|nr:MAG: HEPN domain-containing protein [Spirochaetaceae bacterium]